MDQPSSQRPHNGPASEGPAIEGRKLIQTGFARTGLPTKAEVVPSPVKTIWKQERLFPGSEVDRLLAFSCVWKCTCYFCKVTDPGDLVQCHSRKGHFIQGQTRPEVQQAANDRPEF